MGKNPSLLTTEALQAQQSRSTYRLQELGRNLVNAISFGVPIDAQSTGVVKGDRSGNIQGSWVPITLTQASGTITVNTDLDLPTSTATGAGGTAKLPNVRWLVFHVEYGDRTGTNATPSPPAAAVVSIFKMANGAVTRTSIDLEYRVTGVTPSATQPITVTLFFVPATV